MKTKLKGKIQEGNTLTDDVGQIYLVLEVFNNSIVVAPIKNWQNLSCEIMSYNAMENEGWTINKTIAIHTESP